MKATFLFLSLATVMICGCSSTVSPEMATRLDPKKTGLVLATFSRSGLPEDVQGVSVDVPIRFVSNDDLGFSNPSMRTGRGEKDLWMIELKPGRYRIEDWSVASGYSRGEFADEGYEFEVKAGEVTYLGHLDIRITATRKPSGVRMYSHVRPVLEDRAQESIAAFRRQYPALAAVPIHSVAPAQKFALNRAGVEWGFTTANISSASSPYQYYPYGIPATSEPKWP